MRGTLRWFLCLLICSALSACAEPEAPAVVQPVAGPGVLEEGVGCDAGDEAFVRRVIPHLWGRRALSVHEVDLLLGVLHSWGREGLVRAMMTSLEFRQRWLDVTKDFFAVNHTGERVNACAMYSARETESPDLAAFVRDNAPGGLAFWEPWTFCDLVVSAFGLGDFSPVFRAGLFVQLGSRVFEADVDETELAWRRFYADLFQRTYLHRKMVCLNCHNSEFSVTSSTDAELDRTWEVPGYVEQALFGDSKGRPDVDLESLFRVRDVLAMEFDPNGEQTFWVYADGFSPWGMEAQCGQFRRPSEIEPDALGGSGWFIEELGPAASIWDLERLLQEGFETLRGQDGLPVGADSSVDGRAAFAWMVSMHFVEHVWETIHGSRLTAAHFFPRNHYQRDVLQHLSNTFVQSGFSVQEVIVQTLLHPYFNQASPVECGVPSPYYMSPLFDPWVVDNEVPALRGNGLGELVTRLPARILMNSVIRAMGWTHSVDKILLSLAEEETLDDEEEGVGAEPLHYDVEMALQIDIGMFVMDGEPGFRTSNFQESLAWEEAYGDCRDPFVLDEEPASPDWIQRLLSTSQPGQPLEYAVLALKDRLLADPDLSDSTERALIEALLRSPLSAPIVEVADADAALRRVCAGLLSLPQFSLQGVPLPNRVGSSVPLLAPGSSRAELCAGLALDMMAAVSGCTPEGTLILR